MGTELAKTSRWVGARLPWGLLILALLLVLWRAPFAYMAHREAGTRAFLQAVAQTEQPTEPCCWPVTADPEAEALTLAVEHLTAVNAGLDPARSRWNTYRTLGQIELATGRVLAAQELFRRRLEAAPDDILARFFLGEARLRGGDTYAAIEQWKTAGARGTLTRLGEELGARGQYREAFAAFDAAIELAPTDRESRRAAILLMEEIDPQQALKLCQELIAIAPDWYFGYARSGKILFQEEQYEGAIWFLEQALRCDPPTPGWILELLGRANAALGRWDEAIQAYERAIRERPTYSYTYVLMGDAQCQIGQPGEARFYYEQAVRLGSQMGYLTRVLEHITRNGTCPPVEARP